jgi:hypothetical protein
MASSLMMVVETETCGSTCKVDINVNFKILLEQSNCALVGQIKRFDSIKNARYKCEN